MATINGITLNIQNLSIMSSHRNVISNQPGSDTNYITDMGYNGLELRLEGYEETLAVYDNVIAEFMKTGGQTLVHRSGWQYTVYSAELNPILLEGIADNYFQYDLTLLTSTPYRESTTLSCRAKEITVNNQEWSAEDMPCDNLLDNWSVEDWSAGASSAPDGWNIGGSASVARESTIVKVGTYSAKLTNVISNYADLHHDYPGYNDYKDKEVVFGAWVYADTASRVRLKIHDGVSNIYSSYHSGNSTLEWLEAKGTIASSPTRLSTYLYITPGSVISAYIDAAILIEGDSIPDNTFIRDIDTDGNVDALPDIKITGGAVGATYNRDKITHTDLDATEYIGSNTSYELRKTFTYVATPNRVHHLSRVGCEGYYHNSNAGHVQVRYSIAGAAEVVIVSYYCDSSSYETFSTVTDINTSNNESLEVRYYVKNNVGGEETRFKNSASDGKEIALQVCTDPEIYNIADVTVKSSIANEIEPDTIIRINTDGTGTLIYADDFSTSKYLNAYWDKSGITYDDANDEIDFGNSEYLIYKIDTKNPITGIPEFLATIDIDTGTPTIKISSDDSTYYDIDTSVIDNVSTEYLLDNTSDLSLKGLTTFYIKINCDGSSTCSLTTFSLSIDLITIDVEHPKITTSGGVSTFRCDQHADSGLNCIVSLVYRHRSWPV